MSLTKPFLEKLDKVYKENDYPKAATLLKLARQAPGLEDITKKQVDQFLAAQTSKQVVQTPPPPSEGQGLVCSNA